MSDTFDALCELAGRGLLTILERFGGSGEEQRCGFLALGYASSIAVPAGIEQVGMEVDDLRDALRVLDNARSLVEFGGVSAQDVERAQSHAAKEVRTLVILLRGIIQTLSGAPDDLEARLWGYGFACGLRQRSPEAYVLLWLLGVITEQNVPLPTDIVDATGAVSVESITVSPGRLSTWFSGPRSLLSDVYGWGESAVDTGRLYSALQFLLRGRPRDPVLGFPSAATLAAGGNSSQSDGSALIPQLAIPLADFGAAEAFLILAPLPRESAETGGIAFAVQVASGLRGSVAMNANWTLEYALEGGVQSDVGLIVRPTSTPVVVGGLLKGTPVTANARARLDLVFTCDGESQTNANTPPPALNIGDICILSARRLRILLEADGRQGVDFGCGVALEDGRLRVGGARDGFVNAILGDGELESEFDAELRWSSKNGVAFKSSGSLNLTRSVAKSVGPVGITAFGIGLSTTSGLTLSLWLDLAARLGPLAININGIGGKAKFAEGAGNLGAFGVDVGVLTPSGIGVSVDAGPVTGGGFLSHSENRYSGALELNIYGIAVKAFGIIDTKLPNGKDGYSFVVLISAEFTPIQLGFGFTLNGVGGIIGINRTLDTNALEDLVRSGAANNLLFPRDLASDAAVVISDLGKVFKASEGHHVFGPIGRFGWGTPTLITGDVALILEFPGPKLGLLGEVKVDLPKPELSLVKLRMSVGGQLDYAAKKFALDATLHDSSVNSYPVSGSMAMRLVWGGDSPNFALAVGGFHPAYKPPAGFPKLQPLKVDLARTGNPSVTVSGFLAVTPNTLQIGGDVALKAKKYGISLDAHVGAKAIFVFSPFSFEARIDASVKVSFHGYGPSVHLGGLLSGPSPWRCKGELSVSVLWWDASLSFDETFGGKQTGSIPTLDPWWGKARDSAEVVVGLKQALEDGRNWSPVPPPNSKVAVTLAKSSADLKLMDPLGSLAVRQQVLPLSSNQPAITRFGAAKAVVDGMSPIRFVLPNDGATLVDDPGTTTLATLSRQGDLFDSFAAAQFFDMAEKDKLAAPAYSKYQSGYVFSAATTTCGTGSSEDVPIAYVTTVLGAGPQSSPSNLAARTLVAAVKRSVSALLGLGQVGGEKYVDSAVGSSVSEAEPGYVVLDTTTGLAVEGYKTPVNRVDALIALATLVASAPESAGNYRVAPEYELKVAA